MYLYDADIPLFPLQYFHAISDNLAEGVIPNANDRVFGYIERAHYNNDSLEATIACNKDLADPINLQYLRLANNELQNGWGYLTL